MHTNNFSFLHFAVFAHFDIFSDGWFVWKIENNVNISQAELRFNFRYSELGNIIPFKMEFVYAFLHFFGANVCWVARLVETITNSVQLKVKLGLSLAIRMMKAF